MARHFYDHESASHAIKSMTVHCEFGIGGAYRNGPYPNVLKWCVKSPRQPLINLMNHMRVQANKLGKHGGIASEYGVDLAVGYVTSLDEFFVNPVIKFSDTVPLIECIDSVGSTVIKRLRPSEVQIVYINELFVLTRGEYKNDLACLIQTMVEAMK